MDICIYLGWSHGRSDGSSNRHGVVGWESSHGGGVGSNSGQAVGSVRVGHGTVQQDLGLGVGRGEGKNNLRETTVSQVWGWNRIVGHLQTSAWCGLVAW